MTLPPAWHPSEPLPCPFCGETSVSQALTDSSKWGALRCDACGGVGPEVRTAYGLPPTWRAEAVAEWNSRAVAASVRPVGGPTLEMAIAEAEKIQQPHVVIPLNVAKSLLPSVRPEGPTVAEYQQEIAELRHQNAELYAALKSLPSAPPAPEPGT